MFNKKDSRLVQQALKKKKSIKVIKEDLNK